MLTACLHSSPVHDLHVQGTTRHCLLVQQYCKLQMLQVQNGAEVRNCRQCHVAL